MKKDQTRLMSMLAFVALILSAIVLFALFIAGLVDKSFDPSIFQFISQLLLTVVVIWVGWQFANGLSTFWKVLFIVVAVVAILGSLGITLLPQINK